MALESPLWKVIHPVTGFHAPWSGLDDSTSFRCFATDSLFFFRFDEEVTLGKLRIADLIEDLQNGHREEYGSYKTGAPLFVTAQELLKYRISL